jgi:hypothetical protein
VARRASDLRSRSDRKRRSSAVLTSFPARTLAGRHATRMGRSARMLTVRPARMALLPNLGASRDEALGGVPAGKEPALIGGQARDHGPWRRIARFDWLVHPLWTPNLPCDRQHRLNWGRSVAPMCQSAVWRSCRRLLDGQDVLVGGVVVAFSQLLQDLERAKVELGRVGCDPVDRVGIVVDGLERS